MSRDERRSAWPLAVREADALVSVLPRAPGPTGTPFDVVAAAVAAFAPPGPIAMLGFAAGGLVAPLRCLGRQERIVGVDRDLAREPLFRDVARRWAGPVVTVREDALAWCERAPRGRFSAVIDDLSVVLGSTIVKPRVSLEGLPERLPRLVTPRGVIVKNLLPVPGWSWKRIVGAALGPSPRGLLFECDTWENRVLITGRGLPPARPAGRRVRGALSRLGSSMLGELRVRSVSRA